ncbi:MAG: lysophospholipid acyltransferase family protein [Armatimonadetes bacterium]|nr:lysophospholipid acyltransferase family protein [Armatimonadota bacterium]
MADQRDKGRDPGALGSFWRRMTRTFAYGVLRGSSAVARRLSLPVLWRIADGFMATVLFFAPRRRRLGEANIAAAFPEFSPAECRAVFGRSVRNAGRTMAEMLKLPYLRPEEIRDRVPLPSLEPIREALASGQGVLVVTAHFGQWEWAAIRLAQELGRPMSVVARRHKHPRADGIIREARASHGLAIVDDEDRLAMVRVLKSGGVLGVLPDQYVVKGAVSVSFMGRPSWSTPGPAWLARTTGARVFAGFCVRHWDGSFEAFLLPELEMVATEDREADLVENTQRINAAIEQAIRRTPDNWLWLHDRWKPEEQRAARLAKLAREAAARGV